MLELATLGVLLNEPMHGYRLKGWLEDYMGACLTANYGAIYPLLRRLEEQGLITSDSSSSERGLTRKTYEITAVGRQRWHDEMLSQPRESRVNARSRFMTKYYFFGALEPQERIALLSERLAACQSRLAELSQKPDPLDEYQRQILDFGKQQIMSELGWLELQLARESRAGSSVHSPRVVKHG